MGVRDNGRATPRRIARAIRGCCRRLIRSLAGPGGRLSASHAEILEPRRLLAATPYISEFMASNADALEVDGEHPDWIEIANPSADPVNMSGYLLHYLDKGDSLDDLATWALPAVEIDPGGYLTVYASEREGLPLHASFKLDASGGYLALADPQGNVISRYGDPALDEWYPSQRQDISYGITRSAQQSSLVLAEAWARTLIPDASLEGLGWTLPGFDDSAWRLGKAGIGFDVETQPIRNPGFTLRMVDVIGGLSNISTVQSILNGPMPGGYTLESDTTRDYLSVNLGQGGNYTDDQALPNGAASGETYCLRITADVFIPAGTWSVAVGSDDGFMLRIPGVSFYNRSQDNTSGVSLTGDMLVYNGNRSHNQTNATSGSFDIGSSGLSTTLVLEFWENGGGDDVELSVASGAQTYNPAFKLLTDAAFPGWQVKTTSTTPPPNYNGLIHTNIDTEMRNRASSAYVRIPLGMVANPADYSYLRLRMKHDDGFVAYLNGRVIARRNAPSSPSHASTALSDRPDADALAWETIDVAIPEGLLQAGNGTNILAIHGLNDEVTDGKFLVYPELLGLTNIQSAERYFDPSTPGAANGESELAEAVADTSFSVDRGFHTDPFTLRIATATEGAYVRYTIDGTTPTASHGLGGTQAVLLNISGTTTVRAAAFKPGALPTNVDTQTYIFVADVVQQSPAGVVPAGWPANWSPNTTDYGMDPDIVNSIAWGPQLQQALLDIPTFSIVMNLNDLFGSTGIYSNPSWDGRTAERPASVELIYPDGTTGFQIDAGIRIRGGFSRSTDNPKHAFRLFFRDEYGKGKLEYPVFGPDGASSFDSFDLRTFQNYSWSFQGDPTGVFMRDQFNRDLQLAMGHQGERGDYYHLYINGQYWGLFNTCERPEADYAASYYGGSSDDYDVIKVDTEANYTVYATDGNMDAWRDLWTQALGDMGSNANYRRLLGQNADGTRNPAYPVLLDIDNLIDYMLLAYYGGNLDAPLSSFLGNDQPNNFFAIRDRNGEEGFRFYMHDAEHTLLNVNENRTGPYTSYSADPNSSLPYSNPQFIFQRLCFNAEFRLRVADRVHEHFFNGGVFTPTRAAAILQNRIDEIELAVIAESARWGDAKRHPPLNKDNWTAQVNNLLNNYLPQRSGIVVNQLRTYNSSTQPLYPDLDAPEFINGHGGIITPAQNRITIRNPDGVGTIWYTLDGTDPRLAGGARSGAAIAYPANGFTLSGTTVVSARIQNGMTWSPLLRATFYYDLSKLRISEVMHDPPAIAGDAYDPQLYEFVELVNTGATRIELGGVRLTGDIEYSFASGTYLDGGAKLVLARNAAAFAERYPGIAIAGVYSGALNNDPIVLEGPAGTLLSLDYDPLRRGLTNGKGYSLVAINPAAPLLPVDQYGAEANWRPSNAPRGLPGNAADFGYLPGSVVINEVMTNTTGALGDWIELHNTTAGPIDITGWYLSDDPSVLAKYRIPSTVIPAGGYVVFTQLEHFGNPLDPGAIELFGLSGLGDEVELSSNHGLEVGGYRDDIDFAAAAFEMTFGRHVKSTGGKDIVALSAPTRGGANGAPLVGPIVINEIMYNPAGTAPEFIELYSTTAAAFPLHDEADPTRRWSFIEGVRLDFAAGDSIPAMGYAVLFGPDVVAVPGKTAAQTFRDYYSIPASVPVFGPWEGALNNGGENIKLARFAGTTLDGEARYVTVDQVDYEDSGAWPTAPDGTGPALGRITAMAYGNDPANWSATPSGGTPGGAYTVPAAPIGLSATSAGGRVTLSWEDRSHNEQGFRIERSTDGVSFSLAGTVGSNVRSYQDPATLTPGQFYTYRVRAYNAMGNSAWSNTFSVAASGALVTQYIAVDSTWRYDDTQVDRGTGWRSRTYDDSAWKSGKGLLYREGSNLDGPKNTPLNIGASTFYFRIHFNLDADPASVTQPQLNMILDDAAVIWLNGTDVLWHRIDNDPPLSYSAGADGLVDNAVWEGPFTLSTAALRRGDNVLAVEVHQWGTSSTDVVWGCTLGSAVQVTAFSGQIDPLPDPGSGPADFTTITFAEPVTGFDLSDLRLTRGGGDNLLTAAQAPISADGGAGRIWRIPNLAAVTRLAGRYELKLAANGSGIKGSADPSHFLGADAIETFTITASTLQGTAGADAWYFRTAGSNLEVYASIPPSGLPKYVIPLDISTALTINTGGGDDLIQLASLLPFVPTLLGGDGSDRLILNTGVHRFTSDLARSAGVEQILITGDAVVEFGQSQDLHRLDLAGASRASIDDGLYVRSGGLSITENASLDLNDALLLVRPDPGDEPAALEALRVMLASARNGGDWTGPGLTSSLAIADPLRLLGLSALLNRDGAKAIIASYGGVELTASDILIRASWYGDGNIDGLVDGEDYLHIDGAFLSGSAGLGSGDLDYNGAVDGDDYYLIDSSFLGQAAPLAPAALPAGRTQAEPVEPPASVAAVAAWPSAPALPAQPSLFSDLPIGQEDESPVWA